MKRLEERVNKLEEARSDPFNDKFYQIVCQFADDQNRPRPEKQPNITLTLKQLAGYLPL